MKKSIILIPIISLLLSGCTLVPIGSNTIVSSEDTPSSQEPTTSESSNTSQNPGTSTNPTSEVTSQEGSEATSTPPASSEITDPIDAMYSGFTYPSAVQTPATAEYYEFWHPDTKITVNIAAEPQIFALMDQYGFKYDRDEDNRYQDLYWPVDVDITINGRPYHFEEVGMRRKGNTSRNYFFLDNQRVSDAFSFKLSFNEVWDEEVYAQFGLKKSWLPTDPDYIIRDDRQLISDANGKNGMDKIDIKMFKTNDESLINQPFAFSLFQKYGVITPNSTLANVLIKSGNNTSDMGVVTINETIDKDLMKRYFSKNDAKGDLYKVGWGKGSPWGDWDKGNLRYEQYQAYPEMIAEEDKMMMVYPRYDAKEFDVNAVPLHANLVNLMKVLYDNQGKNPQEYASALEGVVDMNSFLMFAAVSYLTGNQDDIRNNGNNYYIYFNPGQNNKAYFIPYDYDWAVGLGYNNDFGGLKMADLSPFHSKLQGNIDDQNNVANPQDNRLFLYTIINSQEKFNIQVNPTWRNAYYDNLMNIIDGDFYTLNTFQDLYNRYFDNYKNDTNVLQQNSGEVYNNFGGTWLFADYVARINTSIRTNSPY